MAAKKKLSDQDRRIANHIAIIKLKGVRNQHQPLDEQRKRLYMNACAEIAVCTSLGHQYRGAQIGGVPIGISIGPLKIRVAYSSVAGGRLMVNEQCSQADVFVLCEGSDKEVEIIGWIPAEHFKTAAYIKEQRGNTTYVVDRHKLQPLARLQDLVDEKIASARERNRNIESNQGA